MKIGNSQESINSTYTLSKTPKNGGNSKDGMLSSIMKQIEGVQKQLQGLSESEDMSPEQKMEKRKELQQQIKDLNKQMTERQLEIQKESQEKKAQETKKDESANKSNAANDPLLGAATEVILSADAVMSQVKSINSAKVNLEVERRTVQSEIEMDKGRKISTDKKEDQLASINKKLENANNNVAEKMALIADKLDNANKAPIVDKKDDDKIADEKKAQSDERQAANQVGNEKSTEAEAIRQSVDIKL